MSTITLPNIRVSSDLTVRVRLKDGGVAIDWSTLNNIKASIYSDAQRALAGRCGVSIDAEDSTILVCSYAANKPQYVGVNRIVVSAKYMGETKTYDKPAFNFVRWTADQEGEQITIDDPDVDVEIDVEDISSSILQEAVEAAFEAADRANDAAAAAEHMVDIHTGPEGKSAYEVAVEEGYVGTEEEWLASLVGPQGPQGIQGETGEAAGFGTASASLTEDGGNPGVTVSASGSDTAKNFAFTFKNLKGDKGDKGDQGNSGYQGAAGELEVVNNLTDGGSTAALSAEMGKTLEGEVSQLEAEVIYDVTKNNPTAGPNNDGKFESLSALLSDANLSTLIPIAVRCGGMSIRFVQTSDNKYVQYNLTSDSFNTNVFNWQRCYIDTICDVQLINECIKELYIRNNIDLSTAAWFRFFAGWNHHYGVTFYDSNWNILVEIDKISDTGTDITSNPLITTNAGSAVLDWAKIQELCGTDKYVQFPISYVNSVAIKNIEYSPYIKAYEQSADISVLNAGSILVSDNAKVNACIKELYINNQSIDPSLYPIVRLYYGSSNVYGIALFKTHFADVIELYGDSSYLESNIINHQNGFALVDWKKIQEICDPSNYIDIRSVSLSKYITDLHYWSSLYVLYSNLGNIPTYGSDKSVNSGKLYDDLFGSIPMDVYSASLIKVKGDGNLTFGYDSNGRVTATVGSDGIAANFYFGFKSSDIIFKANHKYKLIGLFLNNNFTLSALTGLLQVYANDGAGRLAQEIFALKVDDNYLYIEKELQFEHPFHVNWFCIYHPTNTSEPEGATLTYLDLKIIDCDISDKNNLEGVTSKRIKDISAEQIKAASSENYQHVIDVYPNNTPCQIANLIRGITDASATNRYKILVHDGDYAETDIVTKDYIDIEGVHYQGAKLIHDGNATYNSPDNYSLGSQYSNIPVNTIPWNYKHLIYHMSNSSVKNITLMTVGGSCKYICHQDSSSARFTAIFKHCNFVNGSGSQVLGVGANAEQFFKYIGCQFIDCHISPYNRSSFNLHNWTNKDKPCGLHFEDCNFSHCGWINISELGSGQTDYFTFLNCVCDNPNFTYFKFNGITYTETPPSYSIILRVVGGNLGGIAVEESRQETKYMMQSQYITIVGNSNSIPFGTLLDKSSNTPAANANNGFIYKVSDIDNSGMIVVNTYGVGVGLAVAGNYAQNDEVYINNGKFTKTPNGNIAGYVIIANELSEEGYICVRAKV